MDPSGLVMAPEGPKLYTFTFKAPFLFGFDDSLGHMIGMTSDYANPTDREVFKQIPFVNIRIFSINMPALDLIGANVNNVIGHFYNANGILPSDQGDSNFEGFEQWVTLETQATLLAGEDPADKAYAFHRCLRTLNHFLMALAIASGDIRIRTLDSHELRPAVFIGAITQDREWHYVQTLLMHPEAVPEWFQLVRKPLDPNILNAALQALANFQPYLATARWRARAQYARKYEGDPADSVVSFQIAAESLLFETWRMLFVDEGLIEAQIDAEMTKDIPFKSLLIKHLPGKLGGSWDITRSSTPVGVYWNDLYLLRNRVVHSAYEPHGGDAESAELAYQGLKNFLHERLHANYKKYPRTFLVRLGNKQIEEKGWMTQWMRGFIKRVESEPPQYYWPLDKAGRD
jgi:hypothetical protein